MTDDEYRAEFRRYVESFRSKPENIAAAKQAQAEGCPDIGCWYIAAGLMTKDEVEKKFVDIMNSSSDGV